MIAKDKAIVSGWAAIPQELLPPATIKSLAWQLSIPVNRGGGEAPLVLRCWQLKNGIFYIPRMFFLRHAKHTPYEIQVSYGQRRNFQLKFEPRSQEQVDAVAIIETLYKEPSSLGGIIQAPPGFGKTVVACAAIGKINTTALIVVHKQFLVDQWRQRIQEFLPNARVGIVQQDRCEFGNNYDIAIAMVQSLTVSDRVYPHQLFDWAGIVIFDEVHRIGAPVFSKAAPLFSAKLRLGLSATPRRSDGADDLLYWHIGPIVYTAKVKELKPIIRYVNTGVSLPRDIKAKTRLYTKAIITTILAKHKKRNELIKNWIKLAVERDRKCLVLSERLEQLDTLANMLKQEGVNDYDFYVGGRSKEELRKAARARVILATYQMAKEGLDISDLDVLFFATPMSGRVSVRQSIGRILRQLEGKKQPVVVDFVDNIPLLKEMWKARDYFYRRLGYEILTGKGRGQTA